MTTTKLDYPEVARRFFKRADRNQSGVLFEHPAIDVI